MENNRRWMFIVVSALISLSIAVVTAIPGTTSTTPLYTYRIEQESSEMNFLPTPINEFTYTIENKYTLNYEVESYIDEEPCETQATCFETCTHLTWAQYPTCAVTCGLSCAWCYNTVC